MEKLTKHGVLEASLLPYPFPWHEPIVPVYLAADVDRLALRWTKDKPQVPGWYWWLSQPTAEPEIHHISTDMIVDMLEGVFVDFPMCGQWAGPIQGPLSLPMEGVGESGDTMIGIQMGDEPNTDYDDGFKKGQAKERAAWRKAIKELKEESEYMQNKTDEPPHLRDCWQARVAVLSDLLVAMKRGKG